MALLRPLLPEFVRVAEMDPAQADLEALLPPEAACVQNAVLKRRREFAAGRTMARALLAEFGQPHIPLLPGPQREPCWPGGYVGTITHTHGWAAVAVARAEACGGLGADVEVDTPMSPEVARRICIAPELDWLTETFADPEVRMRWGKLVFSAKEAAYKAQFPRSRLFLGFDAMEIAFDREAEAFTATFQIDAPPFRRGDRLRGAYRFSGGWIASAICLPPPGSGCGG